MFLAETQVVDCPPGTAFAFHERRLAPGRIASVELPSGAEIIVYRLTPIQRASEFPDVPIDVAPEFLALDNTCAHKSARLCEGVRGLHTRQSMAGEASARRAILRFRARTALIRTP